MKKTVSILFALIILLSGMHMSIARHLCGGETIGVKVSVTGETPGCGMKEHQAGYNNKCCENQVSFFSVDNNYNPSSLKIAEPLLKLLLSVVMPFLLLTTPVLNSSFISQNEGPPLFTKGVDLSNICVFRI